MFLFLPVEVKGQEVTDNFNSGSDTGWQHYTPTTSGGATPTYTFPTVGPNGDLGYELFGPAMNCEGLLQRGAAVRSEQYSELFYSVDFLNYAPTYGSDALFGLRISGSLVPLSTAGYFMGYALAAPRNRQALFLNLAFTSEVITKFVDPFRGGSAATAAFPPSRPLRVAVYGNNDLFKSEIYDRTDLLEPLVRINYQDYQHDESQPVHTSGANSLGWLNIAGSYGLNTTTDFTFDNYHATGIGGAKNVGFPGVAQVVNLKPAPQTLFYQPPGVGSNISFTVTTFTTNPINTNQVKLFLNDVDVSSGPTGLSFTEVRTILGTPNTNFTVKWNGTLTTNTIYHGQIQALDSSGKGTTNNFYFDTFSFFNPTNPANPSKFVLIEAEDYNYGTSGVGGQFQDYPLVSGTDDSTLSQQGLLQVPTDHHPHETLGPQVNGAGVGYYNGYDGSSENPSTATPKSDIVGIPDVDYHVNNNNPNKNYNDKDVLIQAHQYRSQDGVVTIQGTKGGGFDTPRSYRSNLVNNAVPSGLSYVPDYIISDMDAGDWLNYTRTFPTTNYTVYLRASSEGRQDVRFDEVTSDRTQTNQTTALRGQFLVPNTESWTRWRYVPLTDGAGNVQTLSLSGVRTLRLTANEVRRDHQLIELGDLQFNWMLLVPTNGAVSSKPWIASAKPSKNSVNFDPAGTVKIVILNRGTAVVPGGIQLRFDGANVTSSATITGSTTEGPGATVSYVPGLLQPNSTHNLSVVYGDGSTTQSNYWTFTVDNLPLIPLGHALGGAPDPAFTVQVHKATNNVSQTCNIALVTPAGSTTVEFDPFEFSNQRAERQLAGQMIDTDTTAPFPNEAVGTDPGLTTNGIYAASVINFQQCGGAGNSYADAGFFTGDTNFPGILPSIYCNGTAGTLEPNHFAIAASIKLSLSPGVYRMGVNCLQHDKDTFKVTTVPATGTELYLASSEDYPGTATDGQFEFVVQTSGLYKFRLLYGNDKDSSDLEWYWVNRSNGVRTLVTPTPQLLSSATVNGSYSLETTAGFDPVAKTITVARSGNSRFYRLSASSALNITNITLSGGNVVLFYQ